VAKTSKRSGGTKGGKAAARTSRKTARTRTSKGASGAKAKKTAAKPRSAGARKKKTAAKASGGSGGEVRDVKTHLTHKELREFRELLLSKRRELVGDLSGMEQQAVGEHGGGNLSSLPTHMADVGTDNFEHEFTLGLLESEQALLREIDEQLVRIEEKTYGICMGTGQPIPKARLRAKPWAKYTVEFTRMLEKGLARPTDTVPDASDEE